MAPRDLIDELLEGRVRATLFGGDRAPRLGRLVILESIGAGAMGTVFAAYDPRLDRKVAVKLLRGSGDEANQRVLGEARALGKLTHPNVVAVHDADEVDGTVYIVMELAPGPSLREWIAAKRTWRDAVGVMQQVAAGLAAAHHAGVIHRDVKPDNILIGPDRVRLVDFGLAARREAGDGAEVSAGTPSYMAPETLTGAPATEASDQFSFGVTLFEVLYGAPPYQARRREDLIDAALAAADAKRPGKTEVPGWLHAVVIRALAADPARRFPSMDAVVDELGRDRRRRQRIAGAAVVGLAALAITGAVAYRGGAAVRDPCAGGPARRAAAVPASAIAAAEEAIEPAVPSAGKPSGDPWTDPRSPGPADWAVHAKANLRERGDAWEATFRRVCEATRIRGDQTDTLYALRMRCLDRRLDRLAALTALLGTGLDTSARAQASTAIAELPRPERCETLTDPGELALPDDPAERARVIAVEHDLDRAQATYALGRYADARTQLVAIETAATGLESPALRASLELLAGSIEARTGDQATAAQRLDAALAAAAAARAPELELEVWARLLRGELFGGDPARVVEWAPFARAAAARAGLAGAEIDGIVGEALRDAGQLEQAREVLNRALASKDPLRGDQRAIIEMNLGAVELLEGHPQAAGNRFDSARRAAEQALGRDHPGIALYVEKRAEVSLAGGWVLEAIAGQTHAMSLRRTAFGEQDRSVATSWLHLAEVEIEAGFLGVASIDLTMATQIRTAIHGDNHVRLGEIALVRGDLWLAAGKPVDAREAFAEAARLDPRIDVTARIARLGDPVAIPALRDDEPLTIDRVVAVAARIARLPAADARTEAAALVNRWRFGTTDIAASMSNAVGDAALAADDRADARAAYSAALAALSVQHTRTRLAALIGLAEASDGDAARSAGAEALLLLTEMSGVDQSPRARLERLVHPR